MSEPLTEHYAVNLAYCNCGQRLLDDHVAKARTRESIPAARESGLDVERLARAIDNFIRKQDGFDVDDAHAIAAEYAALRSDEAVKR